MAVNGEYKKTVIGVIAALVLGMVSWAAGSISTLHSRVTAVEKDQAAHEAAAKTSETDLQRRLSAIEAKLDFIIMEHKNARP